MRSRREEIARPKLRGRGRSVPPEVAGSHAHVNAFTCACKRGGAPGVYTRMQTWLHAACNRSGAVAEWVHHPPRPVDGARSVGTASPSGAGSSFRFRAHGQARGHGWRAR